MDNALCWSCAGDLHLRDIIEREGSPMHCSMSGEQRKSVFVVAELAQLMEPIMREHFSLGQQIKISGDNDAEWSAQQGEPMSWWYTNFLGKYLDFEDELIDAMVEAEDVWQKDGDEAFWVLQISRQLSVGR
jgi:hypothetical protein